MEQEMIYIGKENYANYKFLTPLAFSVAEGGAMGSPGKVIIVDSDKTIYEFSLFDLEGYMADSVLPNMDKAFYASSAELLALGLHHVDLGAGNHLFVNSSIFEQFHPIAQKYKRDLGLLYQKWINIVIDGHDVEVPQIVKDEAKRRGMFELAYNGMYCDAQVYVELTRSHEDVADEPTEFPRILLLEYGVVKYVEGSDAWKVLDWTRL